jgi:N-acetylated-alpha-linked acidic dipeptidase
MLVPARLAAGRLAAAADRMARSVDRTLHADGGDRARAGAITSALIATERAFTDHDGIPGRPWYRHLIYAPKPTYAPEVLPGLAEAIDAGDRERLAAQVKRLAAALDHAAAILNMEPRITK